MYLCAREIAYIGLRDHKQVSPKCSDGIFVGLNIYQCYNSLSTLATIVAEFGHYIVSSVEVKG